jgi:hypothetical protein
MAPRLTPTMRKVLDLLKRERPLTAHAVAGALLIDVRRAELAIGRLRGENLVTIACFDAMGYPAYKCGSPVGAVNRRRIVRR